MRISELSALTGVSPHRLRHYESLGLIVSQRQPNGYRVFSSTTTREVVFIDMSRKMGFSLEEIAVHLPRYRAGCLTAKEMVVAIREKICEIDAVIAEKKKLKQLLLHHIAWFHARRK